MKQFLLIVTLPILFLAGYKDPKSETAVAVMAKVKSNYEKHSSLSYKVNHRYKSFSDDDTLTINASCKLIRDKNDTLFGGYVWYTLENFEVYYDLTHIHQVDHGRKKITEYKAHENQKIRITGNRAGEVINVHFFHPAELVEELENKNNTVSMLDANSHFIVSISYPDKEPFSETTKKVWIKKDANTIDKITFGSKFQGNYSYSEWILSDIMFDKTSATELDDATRALYQTYTVHQHKSNQKIDYSRLSTGTIPPPFTGSHFQTNKDVSLDTYKGKFVILDFSYMSCMPCIKSIPHLRKIQDEYANKNLVVLAINSKDTEAKDKKRLPDFIAKNAVNYPILLTTSKTDSLYNVKAYPTLYAINKSGKIVFSQIGFYEGLADTLRRIIETDK